MNARFALVMAVAIPAALLSGCFGDEPVQTADADQVLADEILGEAGREKLVDAAAIIPKNYSFDQQALLPPVKASFAGRVESSANGGYEAERDEGGIDYNNKIQTFDLTPLLPPGQPAELVLTLFWDASEGNSADLDLVVDVPGTKTSYSATSETFNWNYAVKTMVVNTLGVEGQPATVGVQVSAATATQGFDYALDVEATYVKDVLTPYHPWALDVPNGASGLIFESEKAGGDEHLTARFLLIDPEDNLVQNVDFNDINIPTQSIYIPTPKPGQYVFYAPSMHGGFLRVKADASLADPAAKPLARVETHAVDANAPAPGVAGKDYLNGTLDGAVPKDDVNAQVVTFSVGPTFPLGAWGTLEGQASAMAKITLKSPVGIVHQRTSMARYEDERGSLGYTSSHEGSPDLEARWENLQKGSWTAEVVLMSPAVEAGHTILTYAR